jgi:hypothetical protein
MIFGLVELTRTNPIVIIRNVAAITTASSTYDILVEAILFFYLILQT